MKKDKKNTNNNANMEWVKEFLKTPRGKGVLFFGIYFIFFLILFIIGRTSTPHPMVKEDYERGRAYSFSLIQIKSNNYSFDYQITIDDISSSYKGTRNGDSEMFVYSANGVDTSYYRNEDHYLVNQNNVWLKADNPYSYQEFLNAAYYDDMISRATYISKTDYDSGKVTVNFQISSATIQLLLENKDLDIEEIPNEIIVSTDEQKNVEKVEFILDSYCKVKGICTKNMKITLTYDTFGEIEEIASPVG